MGRGSDGERGSEWEREGVMEEGGSEWERKGERER